MSNLKNFDIKSHVIESMVNVFDTMVSMKIEHSESEPQDTGDADRVVAAVDFAGNVAGILNIQVTTDLARLMTANRLNKEPEELEGDGEIKDLFSEISNIVAGSLKSALNDVGLTCVLSTPSMTYEGDFTIKSLKMERFERFAFLHQQNWIFVEVGLKTQPGEEDGEVKPVSETVIQPETKTVRSEANATESQKPPGPPPTAQRVDHPPTAAQEPKSCEDIDLDLLLDIPLEIKVELGRAKIQIHELLNLAPGSAVKLIKLEGEPVDLFANDTLIARGEVVVQNEKYGIRVTEITSRLDRIRSFGI
ncbi:MAG: flagellar motor switch protein FliN [Desulfobacterales bacterium]